MRAGATTDEVTAAVGVVGEAKVQVASEMAGVGVVLDEARAAAIAATAAVDHCEAKRPHRTRASACEVGAGAKGVDMGVERTEVGSAY